MKALAAELRDGATLVLSLMLGIGAGTLMRAALGWHRFDAWRIAAIAIVGVLVCIGTGAIMPAGR